MSALADKAEQLWAESAQKIDEKCDLYCGRMAELIILDRKGYEIAVTCRECAPLWQYTYQDAFGNSFNP